MSPKRSALALCGAFALALTGCLGAPAPGDHYYRLATPVPDAERETPLLPGALRVLRFRAGPLLDGTRLLFREHTRPSEVQRLAYHHWSDTPSLLLREQMVRYLRGARLAPRVVTDELRAPVAYTLGGRVHRFERWVDDDGERAEVELEFVLQREGDDHVLFHRTYTEVEPLQGAGVDASVAATDRALRRLLGRFVADLDADLPRAGAGGPAWRG